MQRPTQVPDSARWSEKDNEWIEGDEQNGLTTYWRPDGTLVCQAYFNDGALHGSNTRYHPDGTIASVGVWVEGVLTVATNVRSAHPTTEPFNEGAPAEMWVTQMFLEGGQPVAARGFDRQLQVVITPGMPQPPEGVPRDAVGFRDGTWLHGAFIDYVPEGEWTRFDASGRPRETLVYEGGVVVAARAIETPRPAGVPASAVFDDEGEVWVEGEERDGEPHGTRTFWDTDGALLGRQEHDRGLQTREQRYLPDGSLASDCVWQGGMPAHRFFRRTESHTGGDFPNVLGAQPTAEEVEYWFDDHGFMTRFEIRGPGGAMLEARDIYAGPGASGDQQRFTSIEEASRAWRAEGERFTSGLNRWLEELYASDDPPGWEEPTHDREDLQRGFLEGVAALNAQGQSARELFPVFHDAIDGSFWRNYGRDVDQVLHLGAARYCRVDGLHGREVYRVTDEDVVLVPDVVALGASADKRFVGLASAAGLHVRGRDGVPFETLAWPTVPGFDPTSVSQIQVTATGRGAIVACAEGVFALGSAGSARLFPIEAEVPGDGEPLELERVCFSVSPNEALVACGGMRWGTTTSMALLERRPGEGYRVRATSQDDAFFPGPSVITEEAVLFAPTLYASLRHNLQNFVGALALDDLPEGEFDAFEMVWQRSAVVNTMTRLGGGAVVGLDDGYLGGVRGALGNGQVYVGGSILALDASPDGQELLVGSDTGLLTRLRLGAGRASNLIVVDLEVQDAGRVAFWRSYPPLRC